MLWKRSRLERGISFFAGGTGRSVFINIGGAPFVVGGLIAKSNLTRETFNRCPFEDREPVVGTIGRLRTSGPGCAPGGFYLRPLMGIVEQGKYLDIPEPRIPPVGLGFHIVPPHVLLALGKCPRALTGI